MGKRRQRASGFRLRAAIIGLTLFSHLTVTFGFPLPSPTNPSKDTSRPFPCQDHPCGCRTATECWQGDCCCLTLTQKLAWAEARGIEPPAHVRPLADACRVKPKAGNGCPLCVRDQEAPTAGDVRWVVGIFAQKCRGDGPAGLFQVDTVLLCETHVIHLAEPERDTHAVPRSRQATSLTFSPPTPPPRLD